MILRVAIECDIEGARSVADPKTTGLGGHLGRPKIHQKINELSDRFLVQFRDDSELLSAPFWNTFGIEFRIDLGGPFFVFFVDSGVHFGSILASKTAPGDTPTRKGRPSILDNSPMKIKLFDPVAVAQGSRGRPLKRNTFDDEVWASKCPQNDPKMNPKRVQNCIKK